MDMFVVRGGIPLRGRVAVSGSKNASLPIMAAALAVQGTTTLRGVPHLVDVATLGQVLTLLGMRVERLPDDALLLEAIDQSPHIADYELVRKMRASVCVLGPLLASRGRACVSLPGGCHIGHRPIDLHLKGLSALGADLRIERGYVIAEAKRLHGAQIDLRGPCGKTVTGTCNVMAAAALARGKTIIESAATEPEVVDLGNFLNLAGASISGLGTETLEITGVESLQAVDYQVIPDRIEAATLLIAGAVTRSRLTVDGVQLSHLEAVLEGLQGAGATFQTAIECTEPGETGLEQIARSCSPSTPALYQAEPHGRVPRVSQGTLKSITIDGRFADRPLSCVAEPFPGLPTDVQAQFCSLLSIARGSSQIADRVFPDRFMHASELLRMGANIVKHQDGVTIHGVAQLHGASVMASDLRASAALVLAALVAEGETVIRRIYHLDRGYQQLEVKLSQLGASVQRLTDLPENVPASLQITGNAPQPREAA